MGQRLPHCNLSPETDRRRQKLAGKEARLDSEGEAITRSPERVAPWQREVDRCRAKITATEALLLAGHPDVEGLCMPCARLDSESLHADLKSATVESPVFQHKG
jgi:hypothetical protein